MSLFGEPEADESPSMHSSFARSRQSLFDEESNNPSNSNSIFQDDDVAGSGTASPWDMPTPRKQHSRADILRNLVPASDAPDSYIETFDGVVREDGSGGKVTSGGVMRVLAAAKIGADDQGRIMGIIAPGGGEVALGRNEFNVLLGLVGLAQERETISLDGIDERRRSECLLPAALPLPAKTRHDTPTKQAHTMPTHLPTSFQASACTAVRSIHQRALYLLSVTAIGTVSCRWMRCPPGLSGCVVNWPACPPRLPIPSAQKSRSSCGAPQLPPCSALPYPT